MYARGMFLRQVLRGVVLLKLRMTCVPLPVDYSRLKTDDTSGFKNHLLLTRLTCPFEQAAHQQYKRTSVRPASEFGQAQTPASHFFCGSSSLAPIPSLPCHKDHSSAVILCTVGVWGEQKTMGKKRAKTPRSTTTVRTRQLLTLSMLQSRFGDKPLQSRVVVMRVRGLKRRMSYSDHR